MQTYGRELAASDGEGDRVEQRRGLGARLLGICCITQISEPRIPQDRGRAFWV